MLIPFCYDNGRRLLGVTKNSDADPHAQVKNVQCVSVAISTLPEKWTLGMTWSISKLLLEHGKMGVTQRLLYEAISESWGLTCACPAFPVRPYRLSVHFQ